MAWTSQAARPCWRFWRIADGPVPFPEIAAAIPEGHDVVAVLTQVQKLEGVRLVTSEPAGLSLFSDLRAELPKGKRSRSGKAEGDPEAAFAVFPEKVPVPVVAARRSGDEGGRGGGPAALAGILAAFARRQPRRPSPSRSPSAMETASNSSGSRSLAWRTTSSRAKWITSPSS